MTNRELYEMTLAVLDEDAEDCVDYEVRAPKLLRGLIRRYVATDRWYRESNNLEAQEAYDRETVTLDGEFPLSDRFVSMVAHELAALLVARENATFAEQCMARATAELTELKEQELPATIHSIAPECR